MRLVTQGSLASGSVGLGYLKRPYRSPFGRALGWQDRFIKLESRNRTPQERNVKTLASSYETSTRPFCDPREISN